MRAPEYQRLRGCSRISAFWLCIAIGAFHIPLAWAGKVRIDGLEGAMLTNAERYVELFQRKNDPDLSARWRKELHADAPEQIREALQPFGYYSTEIESSLTEEKGDWIAVYKVTLGPPVRVSATDIRWLGPGAEQTVLQDAVRKFPLKKGDVFVHKTYEDGKIDLQDAAYEIGYVKVKLVKHEVRVNPEKNDATIYLELDTGPRYRFGTITLHQDIIDPGLLQQFVTLKQGEPYSNRELLKFQQSVIATGWFSVAEVKPDFAAAKDAEVPIEVFLTPAKRHKVEFGVGYETDIGPRGSIRWRSPRINRRGHQASAGLQLAPVKGDVRANYEIPVHNPRTDRLSFTADYEYEYLNDSDRNTYNLDVSLLRTTLDQKNFFRLFGEFKHERFSAGNDPATRTNILSLGSIVSRTVAEEADFVRSGYNVSADLRVASSALVSDTSFLRGDFFGRYLHPIGSGGRINVRGELGAAWVEDFDKYPNSLRYFAGGDRSIRGYAYKDLGPKDAEGVVIGGKNLLVGSIEYDQRIKGPWVGAGFVDAGNAFNDALDKIYVGAGFGVRWLAPFGSVRFDMAWPVSEDPGLSDVRFHLGLGALL